MEKQLCCPVHGNSSQERYGTRSGYSLRRCTKCGLVYLAEQERSINLDFFKDISPSTSSCGQFPDKVEYWTLPDYYAKYKKVFDYYFEERIQRILSAAPRARSLLDIGCGYGFFLKYAQDYIDNVVGVELNPNVAEVAKAAGLPVYNRSAESLSGEEFFDCIVMCDVLEHLQDPLATLMLCNKMLNPGGVLYIQVPNLLGFKLPYGHSWGLPHHIWQFGKKSLSSLLVEAGFSNIRHKSGILGVVGVLEHGGPSIIKKLEWKAARLFDCGNRLQTIAIKGKGE